LAHGDGDGGRGILIRKGIVQLKISDRNVTGKCPHDGIAVINLRSPRHLMEELIIGS